MIKVPEKTDNSFAENMFLTSRIGYLLQTLKTLFVHSFSSIHILSAINKRQFFFCLLLLYSFLLCHKRSKNYKLLKVENTKKQKKKSVCFFVDVMKKLERRRSDKKKKKKCIWKNRCDCICLISISSSNNNRSDFVKKVLSFLIISKKKINKLKKKTKISFLSYNLTWNWKMKNTLQINTLQLNRQKKCLITNVCRNFITE